MKNEDIKELYAIVPHNTLVTVSYDSMPFRVLKAGRRGSDVMRLQQSLKEKGYFPYYCDGIFGEFTKLSVIQYQKDNDLKVTGEVDLALFNKICTE